MLRVRWRRNTKVYKPRFPRCLLPTTENGSTIEHRSKAWPFISVWRVGRGHVVHPSPSQGAIGCEKTAVRQVPRRRPLPVQPYCGDDTKRHVGAGLGRRPSISRKIAANRLLGIATSATRPRANDQWRLSQQRAIFHGLPADVRLWLIADVVSASAIGPLMTHSGHSAGYAVRQVGPITSDCRTSALTRHW